MKTKPRHAVPTRIRHAVQLGVCLSLSLCVRLLAADGNPNSPSTRPDQQKDQPKAPKVVIDEGRVNAGELSKRDFKFIQNAMEAGAIEVELGQLALQKAKAKSVQDFARQMVKEHTKANQELRQIALRKGETVSTNLSPRAVELSQGLSRSPDFDKAYLEQAVKDHSEALRLFGEAAANVDDPDIKQFAKEAVPTIERHLAQARDLAGAALSLNSRN